MANMPRPGPLGPVLIQGEDHSDSMNEGGAGLLHPEFAPQPHAWNFVELPRPG